MLQDGRGMVAGPRSPSHREYAHLLPGMGSEMKHTYKTGDFIPSCTYQSKTLCGYIYNVQNTKQFCYNYVNK